MPLSPEQVAERNAAEADREAREVTAQRERLRTETPEDREHRLALVSLIELRQSLRETPDPIERARLETAISDAKRALAAFGRTAVEGRHEVGE